MITLVSAVVVVAISLMSLTSSLISKKLYDKMKLLIQAINKEAESKSYVVVTTRFKKFKKDVDQIVYLRYDREEKTDLNEVNFERRIHSDMLAPGEEPRPV